MKKIMWAPIFDFCNESYLIITISIFINLFFWQDQDNIGKRFNITIATSLTFATVIGYPLFCLVFLQRNYEKLH